MAIRLLVAFMALSVLNRIHAEDDVSPYDEFAEISKAVARFETKRRTADAKIIEAFDNEIKLVERDASLNEAAKGARVGDIERAKADFNTRQVLPTDDARISISVSYLDALYGKEAMNVKSQFERMRKRLNEDVAALAKIDKLEQIWLASLPTGDGFQKNGDWFGAKNYSGGNTIDCNFHIRAYANGVIGGSIWWDNRSVNQQGMEVEGRYYGNLFILEAVKSLRGGPHGDSMRGYHLGNRIVLVVTGPKGKTYATMKFTLAKVLN